jgi:riboflavin kinase/FMN adenylyltransferase
VLLSDTTEYDEKIALMFTEHPQKTLSGDVPEKLITDAKRCEILNEWGYMPQFINFPEISKLSPEEFIDKILVEKFNATALCCGFNYRFGKGAKGNVNILKKLCAEREIKLTVCDEVDFEGAPVCSTRIRESIKNGDIRTANKMLGRYFSYDFQVVHGDARGRTLGSPTINQFFSENFAVAEYGVYASFTIINGEKYISVTNIGVRPTIDGVSEKRSETNIVGFSGDLYGQNIEVFLVEKLRGERAFKSLDELSARISADREKSTEIIKKEFQNEF